VGNTLFATLFANPVGVKNESLANEQALIAPLPKAQTSEGLLGYLLGLGELSAIVFPDPSPEIKAILPKAGSVPEFKPDGGAVI
jgi:hypothetical protein